MDYAQDPGNNPVGRFNDTRPLGRDRRAVYRNERFQVFQMEVVSGAWVRDYFVIEHGRRAGLVVIRGDDVLMVRQYRMFIEGLTWEIPGGGVRHGESPEQAAVRECLEETGLNCENLKPLLQYHVGLDVVHNPTYLFHTSDFQEVDAAHGDGEEIIGQSWIPLSDCVQMIGEGQIKDSFSIAALLSYRTFVADRSY